MNFWIILYIVATFVALAFLAGDRVAGFFPRVVSGLLLILRVLAVYPGIIIFMLIAMTITFLGVL